MRPPSSKAFGFVEPMAPLAVKTLPEGPDWSYEVKLDGYRAYLMKDHDRVRLISRNNKDLTRDFAHLLPAASGIRAATAVIDGEIVAVDEQGRPRFQLLQHRSTTQARQIVYYAFDLIYLNGHDLRSKTIERRRSALAPLIADTGILFSDELPGTATSVLEVARAMELEGIVAKRRGSLYETGKRSGAWRKLRINRAQEFVVGGYSPGSPFDSILVGYYAGKQLLFCGRVRAGFSRGSRQEVAAKLKPITIDRCPFSNLPSRKSGGWNEGVTAEEMASMTWVRPVVVVQIAFVEWTTYDLLRHASYLGLRTDKKASDVVREP